MRQAGGLGVQAGLHAAVLHDFPLFWETSVFYSRWDKATDITEGDLAGAPTCCRHSSTWAGV